MSAVIIKENTGDHALKCALIKGYIIPFSRSTVWTFLLVVISYYLFKSWDQKFPVIVWSTPLLVPLLLLTGSLLTLAKTTWVFSDSYIKETGGSQKKVLWKTVQSWNYEVHNESIEVNLNASWRRKYKFVFHLSHGEEYILNLFRKNLK